MNQPTMTVFGVDVQIFAAFASIVLTCGLLIFAGVQCGIMWLSERARKLERQQAALDRAAEEKRSLHELMRSIAAELRELQYKMILAAFRLFRRARLLNEERVLLIRRVVGAYRGPEEDPEGRERLRQFFALPPGEQLAVAASAPETTTNSPLPVKYRLPFTGSQFQALSRCPLDFQQRVMQIDADLQLFNDQSEYVSNQFALTYDSSLAGVNRDIVRSNIEQSYASQAKRCERIVREIDELLQRYGL